MNRSQPHPIRLAIAALGWLIYSQSLAAAQGEPLTFATSPPPSAPGIRFVSWNAQEHDEQWRYTKNGWQPLNRSFQDRIAGFATLPEIDPLCYGLLMLLAVIAAAAWSSSEWDWFRLLQLLRRRTLDEHDDRHR